VALSAACAVRSCAVLRGSGARAGVAAAPVAWGFYYHHAISFHHGRSFIADANPFCAEDFGKPVSHLTKEEARNENLAPSLFLHFGCGQEVPTD